MASGRGFLRTSRAAKRTRRKEGKQQETRGRGTSTRIINGGILQGMVREMLGIDIRRLSTKTEKRGSFKTVENHSKCEKQVKPNRRRRGKTERFLRGNKAKNGKRKWLKVIADLEGCWALTAFT